MKIAHELPPIYDSIIEAGMRPTAMAVYTYGDTIYNPSGRDIPPDVVHHEEVHEKQQEATGKDEWWGRYLEDPYFRISQEVEAYGAQYKFLCKTHKDRNQRNRILIHFARVLSSPTYGETIGTQAAMEMIKEKANV